MRLIISLLIIALLGNLSGCTVLTVAVVATTTVVGGAIDVVDAVTPDIISDDDEEEELKDEDPNKDVSNQEVH
jgi:hypothetical protein